MVIASGNRSREAEMQAGRAATQDRIVETADRLFYERGYDHTFFADIADEVGLSRGNFYYHFKTKDDILTAVIAHRNRKTQQMLVAWADHVADPAGRIRQFIGMLTMNAARIRRHGCPVGTLCTELAKLEHPALPQASQLFTLFRQWLAQQFAQLGYASEADALAMHLLGRSQGIATLASAFNDEAYIQQEVAQLNQWLAQLPPPSGK